MLIGLNIIERDNRNGRASTFGSHGVETTGTYRNPLIKGAALQNQTNPFKPTAIVEETIAHMCIRMVLNDP